MIKIKKKENKMNKIISSIIILILFAGCSSIKEKMPKRKNCTGDTNTLADLICKK
tara:strand:- start:221 stop:385 length:165 start_codon:yes stop_codon:yes gene_type:complete